MKEQIEVFEQIEDYFYLILLFVVDFLVVRAMKDIVPIDQDKLDRGLLSLLYVGWLIR